LIELICIVFNVGLLYRLGYRII